VYTKDRLKVVDELQKLCNIYNGTIEKSMKLCEELNECKKTLSWYEYGDDLDDEALGLYKCKEGDGNVEYFYSGTVNTRQRYASETTSSDSEYIKERIRNYSQSAKDNSYHGVGFKRYLKNIPNTSLQKIVDWGIVFEGEVIYKLSESKGNDDDTFLDRLKWGIEHKYPFILVDVSYPDIGGYLKISTIPNVTRPMTVDDGMFIILPFNVTEKFGVNLDFDYSTECERINIAIGRMLEHCGYKE
jgi:hypothetical protein